VDFKLRNKIAVVTGASRGLGFAIAQALGSEGAKVVLTGRDGATLGKRVNELTSKGIEANFMVLDVNNESDSNKLVESCQSLYGRLDILVNNAGIAIDGPYEQMSNHDIDQLLATNLRSVMHLSQVLGAYMISRHSSDDHGKIINISSLDGLVGTPNLVAYGTTKGAIIQFTRALGVEWARSHINVNAICPGYFETDMSAAALGNDAIRQKILKRIPTRRVGRPEEIGPLAVYLASPLSDFVTSQSFVIDGGETAH
jgi:NAD(P)-dependent dehydrogenase (short-subunit alcohol dehydrogenase family)